MDKVNYKEILEDLKKRLNKIYPDATVENDIDESGNSIFKTVIPGVQQIESMNVNALQVVIENLEDAHRRKLGL